MKNVGCVILSAGKGERMYSETPKAVFPIFGKSMIEYILESVSSIDFRKIYIVVGYKQEIVKQTILNLDIYPKVKNKIVFVVQKLQLGSGHALLQVEKFIDKKIDVLVVIPCDVPLIKPETIKGLLQQHKKENVECCVLTTVIHNPYGYGRIIKDSKGHLVEIVEENDANDIQKKIKEVNTGIYTFALPNLWNALKKIRADNKKNEYYLTDVIKFLSTKTTYLCENSIEVKGVNTRFDISEIENILRKKIVETLMLSGVSIEMPETVFIDSKSKIENDTIIHPYCILKNVLIKKYCEIGPYSFIENSTVDTGTKIVFSYVVNSKIGKNCKIGPFSRIRPETSIMDEVSIGNFVEVKKSLIHQGSKINHLTYIGDTEIGKRVNIGAGVITCNYDGIKKHKTFIGNECFIGSNVNLIAPIKIGKHVVIAAGSTVTKDVPDNTFVISRPEEIHKQNHRIVKRLFNI